MCSRVVAGGRDRAAARGRSADRHRPAGRVHSSSGWACSAGWACYRCHWLRSPPPLAPCSVRPLGHQVVMRRSGRRFVAGDGLARSACRHGSPVCRRLTRCGARRSDARPVRASGDGPVRRRRANAGPRLAASAAGVPLATMLRGTCTGVPLWSSGLVTTGAVVRRCSAAHRRSAHVGGTALVLVLAACLLARRRVRSRAVRFTGSSASHPTLRWTRFASLALLLPRWPSGRDWRTPVHPTSPLIALKGSCRQPASSDLLLGAQPRKVGREAPCSSPAMC
jgi:hypothetical protein